MQEQVKRVVHLHARPEAGKMETVLGSLTPVGKMLVNSNVNVIKNEGELGTNLCLFRYIRGRLETKFLYFDFCFCLNSIKGGTVF